MCIPFNPRFPHTCKITRYGDYGPMTDQSFVPAPLQDEEDTFVGDDGAVHDMQGDRVVYEGICRSFNRDTTSDNGDVNASYRTLALPIKQDEWNELTMPREGDKVEVYRNGYKEYGMVIDRRPGNLGTHILWKYVRD